jgi:hypothetical protein
VPPDWVIRDAGLSSDDDLRDLQLRWLADEIWMRRLVLCVALLIQTLGVGVMFIAPSTASLIGAGVTSMIALPLAYFFGRGLRSRP